MIKVPFIQELDLINLQTLTVMPFIISLICFWYIFLLRKTVPSKYNLPPSPPKLPILGNLHQLGTYPHRFLSSLSKQYGELMLIHVGSAPAIVASSASVAQEIMLANDVVFANRPISKKGRKLLYNGMDVAAAPYGQYWRNMRSICVLHVLSRKMVCSFRNVREEETALVIENIERSLLCPVNLTDMFANFTRDVVCRVAFGRKYGEKEHGIKFNEMMKDYMKVLGEFNVGDFVPWLAWIDRFSGLDAKVDKIAKDFDEFIESVVKEHQDRLNDELGNYEGEENDKKVMDFVDVLLHLQRDYSARFALDRQSIKALVLDMFTGGTDTTAALLEWTMSELLRHPCVMQELQREVREITKENMDVSEEDLEQMKYLKAVIKETLRLHPPAPLLAARQSSHDTNICGYDIPAGTAVITNAWAIHRDPKYWNEPETFNPDRFLNCTADFKGHDLQFIPFGTGRRICPGIGFAMANTELMLAKLVHKFVWSLPGCATLDMNECIGLTMHRSTPLVAVAASPAIRCNGST